MNSEVTQIKIDERGVATLTMVRPEKHNALNRDLIDGLNEATKRLSNDPSVRVVVLRGAGNNFCAGGDLEWMKEQFAAPLATRLSEARRFSDMLRTLNESPKPIIAAVTGSALGGGVGLTCVCDNAIATSDARFGLTETRLGLVPATIGPYVVARLGIGHARRVFMSPQVFSAQKALAIGLIGVVAEPDDIEAQVEAEIAPYLTAPSSAIAAAKAHARRLGPLIDDAVVDDSIRCLADVWQTREAAEGIVAFFEKRKPSWYP